MRIEPLKLPPRLYAVKPKPQPLVIPIITDARGPAGPKALTPSELLRMNDKKVRASRLELKGKTEPEFGFSHLPDGTQAGPQANGGAC